MAKLNGVSVIDMVGGQVTKVAYDGAEYARVELPFREGDIVQCFEDDEYLLDGEFYLVRNDGDLYIEDEDNDDERYRGENDSDFVPFRKITAQTSPTLESRVESLEGRVGALEEAPKSDRLTVGDYAKVIERASFHCAEIGDIVEIVVDERDEQPYRCEHISGNDAGWFRENELVRATDEEVAQAKVEAERKQVEAKWAEIGRKPNEYKKGDIVRVTGKVGGHDVGTLGELVSGSHFVFPQKFGVLANGNTKSHTSCFELITPVEARFDRE